MAPDVGNNAVNSADVANESLTGADIKNKSGVDTCVNTIRLGNLCFRVENQVRTWIVAAQHCANLNLRLPTHGEARALATTYNLPNVDENENFWTNETFTLGASDDRYVYLVSDYAGSTLGLSYVRDDVSRETVCVTTPTN